VDARTGTLNFGDILLVHIGVSEPQADRKCRTIDPLSRAILSHLMKDIVILGIEE